MIAARVGEELDVEERARLEAVVLAGAAGFTVHADAAIADCYAGLRGDPLVRGWVSVVSASAGIAPPMRSIAAATAIQVLYPFTVASWLQLKMN